MQLHVIKCDGTREVYLHTKVMASLASALAEAQLNEIVQIDALAEAVTTYIKKRYGCGCIESDEIHAMLLAILCDINCEKAAFALNQHRLNRQLLRNRIEVITQTSSDTIDYMCPTHPWNKSIIVQDLETKILMPPLLARAIASAVENRVLKLDCRHITSSLIRELVQNEIIMLKRAETSLSLAQKTLQVEEYFLRGQPLTSSA